MHTRRATSSLEIPARHGKFTDVSLVYSLDGKSILQVRANKLALVLEPGRRSTFRLRFFFTARIWIPG